MRLVIRLLAVALLVALAGAGTFFLLYGRDGEPERFSDDTEHFKYGSIGAEVNGYPYIVWRTLPHLFPDRAPKGWGTFGFYQEPGRVLPVGVSVRKYGIPRVGFNCGTCHTSTVNGVKDIILGAPANKVDLGAYLQFLTGTATDPRFTPDNILAAPSEQKGGIGWLDRIVYRYFIIPKLVSTLRQVAADNRWRDSRPPQGPGRTDAGNSWRLRFQMHPEADQAVGTTDFPSLWNQQIRTHAWLHWDGNNRSLNERNLSAALAGGATEESLDHAAIERVAAWSMTAPPPQYPFPIDSKLATAGEAVYLARKCGACHDPGGPSYGKVTPIGDIGTDRQRLDLFSESLLSKFATVGQGRPWQFHNYRKSDGYANTALDGIWARGPYLHNGSVPTLFDLLATPGERPNTFFRGCDTFDPERVGFVCTDGFAFDTGRPGNSSGGHLYGTDLTLTERHALIEYLKTK